MPSKQYEEKQAVEKDLPKESSQDKLSLKVEKDNLKSEKEAIGGKEYKEKEKEYKDKDKEKEQHKDKEKEHKLEGLEKPPKIEGHEIYPQAQLSSAAPASVVDKALHDKFVSYEKPLKEGKPETKEHKDFIKEIKLEKFEKLEYEHLIGYGPGYGVPGGPVEQRLAALEAAVTQLLHFIPENLRPDLSRGALKQEPDVAQHRSAGTAKAPESKDPQKAKS
jgi:hypothetical protein